MKISETCPVESINVDIDLLAKSIIRGQLSTGEIPWHDGGKTDPWDHIESAMALAIGGYHEEAKAAYEWLKRNQLEDGSWYSSYMSGVPEDMTRESNMSTYIAVGVLQHYLITSDRNFVEAFWPTISKGIDFALGMQSGGGEIFWARSPKGDIDPMALLTGSSSVFLSLRCALALASVLGIEKPNWIKSLNRLEDAIRYRPHLFNREKARYSMDWYYPVLCSAMTGLEAINRIEKSWEKFTVENWGIRCVSDRPWVTMAETSELTLALAAMGKKDLAATVFSWIQDKKFDDGTYWCGVTFPDRVIWPEEKLTWTNAVVVMAYDVLKQITPASWIFNHSIWEGITYNRFRHSDGEFIHEMPEEHREFSRRNMRLI